MLPKVECWHDADASRNCSGEPKACATNREHQTSKDNASKKGSDIEDAAVVRSIPEKLDLGFHPED